MHPRHAKTVLVRQENARAIGVLVNVVVSGTREHGNVRRNGIIVQKIHKGIPLPMIGSGIGNVTRQDHQIDIVLIVVAQEA
jgi:hypothetical protein